MIISISSNKSVISAILYVQTHVDDMVIHYYASIINNCNTMISYVQSHVDDIHDYAWWLKF
jgi:hypothetical protein